jgi:hypothetical protein
MSDTDIERRVQDVVRGRPAPEPSEAQMQAILSRRSAGERLILPADREPPVPTGVWRWVVVASLGAAASVLAVSRTAISPSDRDSSRTAPAQLNVLGPDQLFAQATDRPTFPLIRPLRPLRPGVWRYGLADGPTGPLDSLELWTQELSTDTFEGVPAYRYRYGKRKADGTVVLTDTLWLNRETLRPLARAAGTLTGGHVAEIYLSNAILSGRTTPGGMTSWVSHALDSLGPRLMGGGRMPADLSAIPGPVAPWRPQIGAALAAADLRQDWRGSMEALIVPGGYWAVRFWLNFHVVGEEQIAVPAGTFEAWKIQVGQEPGMFAWVSKDRQWLLRLGEEGGRGWSSQQVLVAAEESKE